MNSIITEEKGKTMKQIKQRFQVTYQYPVVFTRHLFQKENNLFSDFLNQFVIPGEEKRILFVLDEGMLRHHPRLKAEIEMYFSDQTAIKLLPFTVVPGGERVKNNKRYLEEIITALNTYRVDRHSYVVAVGGGAVLDLVGYAAAITHRGIRHIRIPTTVLSQNDSGVGVKNGINYFGKKNFLGTFAPPFAVFNDFLFLDTLDDRSWRSGIAEAVKVALIKDAGFFGWLEEHAGELSLRDTQAMEQLVYRCAELHLAHIASGDPFESGSSRPLDFGHWSAHKLEQLTDFDLTHGEAVAIGIALDVIYSEQSGWLRPEDRHRILNVMSHLGFSLFHRELEAGQLLQGLSEFREHLGGQLTVMMLKAIGEGKNVHAIDKEMMRKCVRLLKAYNAVSMN